MSQHEVNVWYSEPIDKIRVTATPGGIVMTVHEAKEWVSDVEAAISEAERV